MRKKPLDRNKYRNLQVYMPINEFIQRPITAVRMWNAFATTAQSQCLMELSSHRDKTHTLLKFSVGLPIKLLIKFDKQNTQYLILYILRIATVLILGKNDELYKTCKQAYWVNCG